MPRLKVLKVLSAEAKAPKARAKAETEGEAHLKLVMPTEAAKEAAKLLKGVRSKGLVFNARAGEGVLELWLKAKTFTQFRARLTSALRDIKVVLDVFKLTQRKLTQRKLS